MPTASEYLFVYGTLRCGAENHAAKLLRQSADHVGRGRARGQLYMVADYPGLVPSDIQTDWVVGDVYHLHSPELTYPQLDKYEGCALDDPPPHEYRRSLIPVLLDCGAWIQSAAYVYVQDIAGKRRIDCGDYWARDEFKVT